MWLEDPITKLEKAAHDAWPGVLEEAQLPMAGWCYVLLSKREEKDRARISYLVEHPSHGLLSIGCNCGLAHRPPLPRIICDWKKHLAPFSGPNGSL